MGSTMLTMALRGLMLVSLMGIVTSSQNSSRSDLALIISGGFNPSTNAATSSVEVYVVSTGKHCQLPDMPGNRLGHSMEDMAVCGGFDTATSCLTLMDGTWEMTTTLLEDRFYHSSWASPSGVRILGGETSEKIQDDGTSVRDFDLEYSIGFSCAINIGSTVILTGGLLSPNRVSQYSESGYLQDLPQLLEGRYDHGCSYFESEDGSKTFLVTGGRPADGETGISSTEILMENSAAWILSGNLPSPRNALRGANIDNKVIMTGGDGVDISDDILQFQPDTGEWIMMDKMMEKRSVHALSVISAEDVQQFCD